MKKSSTRLILWVGCMLSMTPFILMPRIRGILLAAFCFGVVIEFANVLDNFKKKKEKKA